MGQLLAIWWWAIDVGFGWLVLSTHLKNISQNGNLPQIGMKIKHIWNHHLVLDGFWHMSCHSMNSPLSMTSKNIVTITTSANLKDLHSSTSHAYQHLYPKNRLLETDLKFKKWLRHSNSWFFPLIIQTLTSCKHGHVVCPNLSRSGTRHVCLRMWYSTCFCFFRRLFPS